MVLTYTTNTYYRSASSSDILNFLQNGFVEEETFSICDITDLHATAFRRQQSWHTAFVDSSNTDYESFFVDGERQIQVLHDSASYSEPSTLTIIVNDLGTQSDLFNSGTKSVTLTYDDINSLKTYRFNRANHPLSWTNPPAANGGIHYGYDSSWNAFSLLSPYQAVTSGITMSWGDQVGDINYDITFNSNGIDWDDNGDLTDFSPQVFKIQYTSSNDEVTKTLLVGGVSSNDITVIPFYDLDKTAQSLSDFFGSYVSSEALNSIGHHATLQASFGGDRLGYYTFSGTNDNVYSGDLTTSTETSNFKDLLNTSDNNNYRGAGIDFTIQFTDFMGSLPDGITIPQSYREILGNDHYLDDYQINLDSYSNPRASVYDGESLVSSEVAADGKNLKVINGGNQIFLLDVYYFADSPDDGLVGDDLTDLSPTYYLTFSNASTTLNWSDAERLYQRSTFRAVLSGVELHYTDPAPLTNPPYLSNVSFTPTSFIVIVTGTQLISDDDVPILDSSGNNVSSDPTLVSIPGNFDKSFNVQVISQNLSTGDFPDFVITYTFQDVQTALNTITSTSTAILTTNADAQYITYQENGLYTGQGSLSDAENTTVTYTIQWYGKSNKPNATTEHSPFKSYVTYGDAVLGIDDSDTDYNFTSEVVGTNTYLYVRNGSDNTLTKKNTYTFPTRYSQARVTETTTNYQFTDYTNNFVFPGFDNININLGNILMTITTYDLQYYNSDNETWTDQSITSLGHWQIDGSNIESTRTVTYNENIYMPNEDSLVVINVDLTFQPSTFKNVYTAFYATTDLSTPLGTGYYDFRFIDDQLLDIGSTGTIILNFEVGNDFVGTSAAMFTQQLATEPSSVDYTGKIYDFSSALGSLPNTVFNPASSRIYTLTEFDNLYGEYGIEIDNIVVSRSSPDADPTQSVIVYTITSEWFSATITSEANFDPRGFAFYYNQDTIIGWSRSDNSSPSYQYLSVASFTNPSSTQGIQLQITDDSDFRAFSKTLSSGSYVYTIQLNPDQFSIYHTNNISTSTANIEINTEYFGDGYDAENQLVRPTVFQNYRGYKSETVILGRPGTTINVTTYDKNENQLSQTITGIYAGYDFAVDNLTDGEFITIDFIKSVVSQISNPAADGVGEAINNTWSLVITPANVVYTINNGYGDLNALTSAFSGTSISGTDLVYYTTLADDYFYNSSLNHKRFVLDDSIIYSATFDKNDLIISTSGLGEGDVTTLYDTLIYTPLNGVYSSGSPNLPQDQLFDGGYMIDIMNIAYNSNKWNNSTHTEYIASVPSRHYVTYITDTSLAINYNLANFATEYGFLPVVNGSFGSYTFGGADSIPSFNIARENSYKYNPLELRNLEGDEQRVIKTIGSLVTIVQRSLAGIKQVWSGYPESVTGFRTDSDSMSFYGDYLVYDSSLLKPGSPSYNSGDGTLFFETKQYMSGVVNPTSIDPGVILEADLYNILFKIVLLPWPLHKENSEANPLSAQRQNEDSPSALSVSTTQSDYDNLVQGAYNASVNAYVIGLTPEISSSLNIYFKVKTSDTTTYYKIECTSLNWPNTLSVGTNYSPTATNVYYYSEGGWTPVDVEDPLKNLENTILDITIRIDSEEKMNLFLQKVMPTVNDTEKVILIDAEDSLIFVDCANNELFVITNNGSVIAPFGIFNRSLTIGQLTDNTVTSQKAVMDLSYKANQYVV